MADSFQACPAHSRLDDRTGFRYMTCMPLDGGKAYSIYDAMRRMLDPLRRDWEKFTPAERELIIREIEAFLRSVKPDENAPH
jgi:hypothetical protein